MEQLASVIDGPSVALVKTPKVMILSWDKDHGRGMGYDYEGPPDPAWGKIVLKRTKTFSFFFFNDGLLSYCGI